jgi:hypothetical protein
MAGRSRSTAAALKAVARTTAVGVVAPGAIAIHYPMPCPLVA